MRYRYILSRNCKPSDSICDFRLISHREIGAVAREAGRSFYRVCIPSDLQLEKYSCDPYATTNDTRTIGELGFDIIMTMWDGSRKILPKGADVEAISKEQFQKWRESLFKSPKTAYRPYPPTENDHISKPSISEIISKAKSKEEKSKTDGMKRTIKERE